MKQPEVFKNFRLSWETPIFGDKDFEKKELARLREKCLEILKHYREEKKRFEKRNLEREEVLKYFDFLDSLDK